MVKQFHFQNGIIPLTEVRAGMGGTGDPPVPVGGSPDGTGQWPVLPTAYFRQRHNPS